MEEGGGEEVAWLHARGGGVRVRWRSVGRCARSRVGIRLKLEKLVRKLII